MQVEINSFRRTNETEGERERTETVGEYGGSCSTHNVYVHEIAFV